MSSDWANVLVIAVCNMALVLWASIDRIKEKK